MNDIFKVSPREAWLERENARLRSENEYLKHGVTPSVDYLMSNDPPVLCIANPGVTLRLACSARMYREPAQMRLHAYVRPATREFGEVGLQYFVSDEALLNSRDRASIMADMHEKLVMDLGRHLWDKP